MKSMVVFFALVAAACGSLIPAQPPHHPAIVLDPHGRPLDTAEVINSRALHLQAKALEHSGPYIHAAPIAHSVVTAHGAPLWGAHSASLWGAQAAPLWGASALAGHGHYLHKRSLGYYGYAAPLAVAHAAPAVSHQSRVDVISSPAVVSHAVAAPVYAHAAPVVAHVAPAAAVSHQSRVDVHSSPAVAAHSAWAPAYGAHTTWTGANAYGAHAHGVGLLNAW